MNPSLAHTIAVMQKLAAPIPPATGSFLPLAGAGMGYMAGGDSLPEKIIPAGIGYYLANMYQNMSPEQKQALWGKNPELAQQAANAAAAQAPTPGTIPELKPGSPGTMDPHAAIRPANLQPGATLHQIEVPASGGRPAHMANVWRVEGPNGTVNLHNGTGGLLKPNDPLGALAQNQIEVTKSAPAVLSPVAAVQPGLQQVGTTFKTTGGLTVIPELITKGKRAGQHNFYYADAQGNKGGMVYNPQELKAINTEFSKTLPPKPIAGPTLVPRGKGWIEAAPGEFYNKNTNQVMTLGPGNQGLIVEQNPQRIAEVTNKARGISQNTFRTVNPLTNREVLGVPTKQTAGVPGVSGPRVDRYQFHEIDPKAPGHLGAAITDDLAHGTLNEKAIPGYNKPQSHLLVDEYKQLAKTQPNALTRALASGKNPDAKAAQQVAEYEAKVADLRARDLATSSGNARVGLGRNLSIKNPLHTTESRMNFGRNIGGATGAIAGAGLAGWAGGHLGGMAGKAIGDDYETAGSVLGTGAGLIGGGIAGYKGGRRFIGNSLGDSLGKSGPASAINSLNEKIPSKLLAGRKFPIGRAALGLGAAGIGAGLLANYLWRNKDKPKASPSVLENGPQPFEDYAGNEDAYSQGRNLEYNKYLGGQKMNQVIDFAGQQTDQRNFNNRERSHDSIWNRANLGRA